MIKNKLPAIRVPFVWALVAATGFVGMSGVALAQAMGEGFEPDSSALQDVEVRAQRPNDLQQRRFSNASKTVVGREEIQKYGDTSLEDVLRRQPGVTVPSGGGNPRRRTTPKSFLRRYFGMNMTWYLHCHFVWLRLL